MYNFKIGSSSILFSNLYIGLISGLFLSNVPTKILFTISHFLYTCYMLTCFILLDLNICLRIKIMKQLIMQFSSASCHTIPLRSKISPQHSVFKLLHFIKNLKKEQKNVHG